MSQLIAQTQQGGRSKRVKKEKQERVRTFKTAQAVKLAALFPGTRAVAAAAAPGAGASPNTAHISATTDTCTASIGAPTSGAGKSDNRRMTSVQAVLPNRKKITFPYGIVAAPMVGASDLAFRLLCRRHGVQLCYSEMLHSDRVADPEKGDDYLHTYLQPGCAQDRPLVVQICGRDPNKLLVAAQRVEPHCDAVDINLGCPQRHARDNGYGAYLLDPSVPGSEQRLREIVGVLSKALRIPVFCKMRILHTVSETVKMAQLLEASGCSLLAIHGRTCDWHGNGHKRRRSGPANLDAVAAVKAAVTIPVLCNGNVRTRVDVISAAISTGADGIMSACGILENPALFEDGDEFGFNSTSRTRQKLLDLALEYLDLFQRFPAPNFQYARAHIVNILGRRQQGKRLRFRHDVGLALGGSKPLRDAIAAAQSVGELRRIVQACLGVEQVSNAKAVLGHTENRTTSADSRATR